MQNHLIRNWRALAARGALAICVGGIAFVWPHATISSLIFLTGGYVVADGLLSVLLGGRRLHEGWHLFAEGVLGTAVGAVILLWSGVTTPVLIGLLAIWGLLSGCVEIALAVRLRRRLVGFRILGAAGVASLAFGVILFARPAEASLDLVVLFGGYVTVFGLAMSTFAFKLREIDGGL